MKVRILVGAPGSGKSTWARKQRQAEVFSADDYFICNDGVYRYDPTHIGMAHERCLRRFLQMLLLPQAEDSVLIVDNTNTRMLDMAPYIRAAQAICKHDDVEIRVFLARNPNVHGVPPERVDEMHKAIDEWMRADCRWTTEGRIVSVTFGCEVIMSDSEDSH